MTTLPDPAAVIRRGHAHVDLDAPGRDARPLARAPPGGARRWRRALRRLVAGVCTAALAGAAPAADALLADLEQRLASAGVESVNEHLVAAASGAALARLHRMTAACELQAVSLTVRLARGAQARAVQAHEEALRAAGGRCARFVLALVEAAQVPQVCAAPAAWGAARTARELRRRIAEIDADAVLRGTAPGRACRAAYLDELKNTRVTLRVASPPPPPPPPR